MSYSNKKITSAEITQNYVKSAPDTLTGDPQVNKNVFDKLIELFIAKYNSLIDNLDANDISATYPITLDGYTIKHVGQTVTPGTYGSTSTQSPTDGGTFRVPYLIVDGFGHVVNAGEANVQLPKNNYVHEQATSSTTWVINHNLGKYPSITVIDSGGSEVKGEVEYVDTNNVTLTFSAAFSGKAFLN